MGLRISGVFQLASGLPFNVTTGSDDNLDGITSDRPPDVGRNTGKDTPLGPINQLRAEFNAELEKIELLAPGLYTDLPFLDPVTALKEPSFEQVDLRIYRPFSFDKGKGRGEFFVQVFNVLDTQNAGLIEGRVLSQSFGQTISLAGPPRSIEMGLKFGH